MREPHWFMEFLDRVMDIMMVVCTALIFIWALSEVLPTFWEQLVLILRGGRPY